jgi:hypothetical protein
MQAQILLVWRRALGMVKRIGYQQQGCEQKNLRLLGVKIVWKMIAVDAQEKAGVKAGVKPGAVMQIVEKVFVARV